MNISIRVMVNFKGDNMKKKNLLAVWLVVFFTLSGTLFAKEYTVKFHHVIPSQKQYLETYLVKS